MKIANQRFKKIKAWIVQKMNRESLAVMNLVGSISNKYGDSKQPSLGLIPLSQDKLKSLISIDKKTLSTAEFNQLRPTKQHE